METIQWYPLVLIKGILGGELPTDRLGGAHNPGDFNGISGGNVHLYLGWTNPLTIRGMDHQVQSNH